MPTNAHAELTVDVVVRVCKLLFELGVSDFKLTGGDPALWSPLIDCVSRLKLEVRVPRLEVISRHPAIGDVAADLRDAGLDVLNISIDTLNPALHRKITGIDDLGDVLGALRQCRAAGLACKVNTVIMAGVNDDEVDDLVTFCESTGVSTLKFLDVIRDLDHGSESFGRRLIQIGKSSLAQLYFPIDVVRERVAARAVSSRLLSQGDFGHPMAAYRLHSGMEVVIKDHHRGAWYGDICKTCRHYPCHDALMAIRLTADARLQYCLLREDITVTLASVLGSEDDVVLSALSRALSVYESATFTTPGRDIDPIPSGTK